jgi:uncharacterized repeat protein (TIGR03803 family)
MKTLPKIRPCVAGLVAGLGVLAAGTVGAQTWTELTSLTSYSPFFSTPGLILSGGALFGTSQFGGSSGNGSVFAVNTDGTGFTILHNFAALDGATSKTNIDGAYPVAGLLLSGNTLYGTASQGGGSGNGTVFSVHTDGSGFEALHSFSGFNDASPATNFDGSGPSGRLIMSGDTLYGTASAGGVSGNGTLFSINTNGSGFRTLHSFSAQDTNGFNSDGSFPVAGLVLSGETLYGTTGFGGALGKGTVFGVNTDGTAFTNLHDFKQGANANVGTSPIRPLFSELVFSGGVLYGAEEYGANSGYGILFAIGTNGVGLNVLHTFTNGLDGTSPTAIILSGNTLYGAGLGTVFAINTNGAGFTDLYQFSGEFGLASVSLLSANALYGTAFFVSGRLGGANTFSVFSLSFAPQIGTHSAGADIVLSWPTNVAGFDYTGYNLQSTTNLSSPASWTTATSGPVVVDGQLTVTNPIASTAMFYRLRQ